jgi:hypothetical protein
VAGCPISPSQKHAVVLANILFHDLHVAIVLFPVEVAYDVIDNLVLPGTEISSSILRYRPAYSIRGNASKLPWLHFQEPSRLTIPSVLVRGITMQIFFVAA